MPDLQQRQHGQCMWAVQITNQLLANTGSVLCHHAQASFVLPGHVSYKAVHTMIMVHNIDINGHLDKLAQLTTAWAGRSE